MVVFVIFIAHICAELEIAVRHSRQYILDAEVSLITTLLSDFGCDQCWRICGLNAPTIGKDPFFYKPSPPEKIKVVEEVQQGHFSNAEGERNTTVWSVLRCDS